MYVYIYIVCVSFIYIYISIQPLGQFGQEPEPSQATGMALVRCILGKFLGVVRHCFPPRLDVPTFTARCLHVHNDARDPSSERRNYGRERLSGNFAYMASLIHAIRDLLHAANLRHGTDGFTSPPKEGVLRIFSPLKNPRTWVLEASTLPLDHRSRSVYVMHVKMLEVSLPCLWVRFKLTASL
jgi:hypothetical protein